MSKYNTFTVRVRSVTYEALGILSFELVPLDPATELPAFTAGSHIDLLLPQGLVRSYSLLNDPQETHRYLIAVNRDAKSLGGSRYLHEVLRAGDPLEINAPRNNFAFDETAPSDVFIAGGIGITPMLSMIARANSLRRPWKLYYSARTPAHTAFAEKLEALAQAGIGEFLINYDQAPGGHMLDLAQIVRDSPDAAHLYCCGPQPMLAAFEKATVALPNQRVHLEYFSAAQENATTGGFSVTLARSKKVVQVMPGNSILDTLIAMGVEPPYSCKAGVCGTCEVAVLDGIPDHRDVVLSAAEKAENRRIMLCCSGAKTPTLTLDL